MAKPARSYVLLVLKLAVLVYLGFGVVLYLAQRTFLYFPVPENPADDVAVERVAVAGGELKVWVVNPGQPAAAVYFGGNAEDVYHNADDFGRSLPGHTVYLVNYRGYGGSSGSPGEAELYADALAVFDRVRPRHARIAVLGRSLGSGVAAYLAGERAVAQLVLITPYDSVRSLAERRYPAYPVALMLKDHFDSLAHLQRSVARVLLLIAENDNLIPRAHSDRLAAVISPERLQQVVIAGAGHNGLSGSPDYWRAISGFLRAD